MPLENSAAAFARDHELAAGQVRRSWCTKQTILSAAAVADDHK
jgi:hypothetical protein